MNLTQQELYQGTAHLNRHAVHLRGHQISFYIHYWGGDTQLLPNELHKHSFFELCYVVSGEGIYWEDNMNYPLKSGDLLLSRPHIKHRIYSTSELFIVFVAFEPLYMEASEEASQHFLQLSEVSGFLLHETSNSVTTRLWEALLILSLQENPLIEDTIENLSCAMLAQFIHLFLPNRNPSTSTSSPRASTTLVHRAKLYIRDNLSEPLRLIDVASYLHLSSRHLSRIFAEELGQTYSHYVRQERIRQASQLLSTTDRSIKSIAKETGFTTVHYFTSVFKEVLGVNPGEFLKKLSRNE